MGYIKHHAIVVTCWNSKHIEEAHSIAVGLGLRPTDITPEGVNGYRSFMIPPDGSKEGWTESSDGDDRRESWIKVMAEKGEDNYCEWCEVSYGSDDGAARVERSKW